MPTRAATLYAIAAGIGAAGVSALAATGGVALFESQTRTHLESALESGDSWLRIEVDGTIAVLSGEAPSVSARRAALTRLGAVRNGLVMLDTTTSRDGPALARAEPKPEPLAKLALRILLNDDEITLIGEIPRTGSENPLEPLIRRHETVTDMTLTAEGRVPQSWGPALALAVDAAGRLQRGQVLVTPDEIVVEGTVAEAALRDPALAHLAANRPEGARLLARLTAPRDVIAPFPFTAQLRPDGTLLVEDCAAPDTGTAQMIEARVAGLGADIDCRIGLGAPSSDWPAAVIAALDTLESLGSGKLSIADSDVSLTGPRGMAPARFTTRTDALSQALPPAFALMATLPPPDRERGPADPSPPTFKAVRSEDGAVRMRGDLVSDELHDKTLVLAEAHFGFESVVDETEPRADLPPGWSARVIAGLEALGRLQHGQLEVTEDVIHVIGTSASETVEDDVREALAARLPDATDTLLELWVSEELAVDQVIALPGELCAEQISLMLEGNQILFPPGETDIADESLAAIDGIAEVLKQCPGAKFEIEGHTDSQGRESSNMAISQTRADAVVTALLERGVDMVFLYATGYGESRPIADNDTEEGRARNRRIAFRLVTDEDETEAEAPEDEATAEGSVMAEAEDGEADDDTVTTRASMGPTPIIESTTADAADGEVGATALSVEDDSLESSGHDGEEFDDTEAETDPDLGEISDHTDFHDHTADGDDGAELAQADAGTEADADASEEQAADSAAREAEDDSDADADAAPAPEAAEDDLAAPAEDGDDNTASDNGATTEADAETAPAPDADTATEDEPEADAREDTRTRTYSGVGPGRPRARPEDLPAVD